MKLYNVPNNSKVRVLADIKIPPGAKPISIGSVLEFKHIDGMYSLCVDVDGDFVHLVAWAEVEII